MDGLWLDYPLAYRLGPVLGELRTKYGWKTGFIPLNTLTYPGGGYTASLAVGRNQSEEMLLFEQAEAVLDVRPRPVGLGVRYGWFREPSTGLETSRSAYEVRVAPPTAALGARTTLSASLSYRDAYYGTGHRYIVSRGDVALVRMPTATSSIALRYQRLVPEGTTTGIRVAMLLLAFVLIAVGVAAYLASATGAGPAEAMAIAWDPPIPFRWSYNLVQAGGALVGWLLGAAVGPGTVLVFLLLGPAVDLFRRTFPTLERASDRAA